MKCSFTGIGDISQSTDRILVAVPSVELMKEQFNVYYAPNTSRKDIYWSAFMHVFSTSLWLAVCFTGLCFFVCIAAILTQSANKVQMSETWQIFIYTGSTTAKAFACQSFDSKVIVCFFQYKIIVTKGIIFRENKQSL